MAVMLLGDARRTVRVGIFPAYRQCRPDLLVPRRGRLFYGQPIRHTTADRFRKRHTKAPGPAPKASVLAFGKLYLCTHHNVIEYT